ncbi:MAG TPA: alpha-amylase/4-alpha-glucanotransferase domain-containing protein [Candidatus Eremiobacteraceae bacterium]|nr:alpha-amylase/4-alpha-glucanotransferase domain-containing protein [Candidatus Eremiobacteraceae bacterium]
MSETVKLLFGVHAHQPAGNFPKVVRDACDRCYSPFFEVLERHPEFKFAMHVSGWLLDFLTREFPDDVRRLRTMIARGQLEVFGGGDTEPILASLSETDRRGQIGAMNERVKRTFDVRPRGAWLAERVWEATVVPSLVNRGIRYVAVDDFHFLCAGQEPQSLHGYFSTEEGGKRLDLFPISETLRYRIPFAPVSDTIAYIESLPATGAAIYFDDIEKFGIWPETHEWVYGRRWLEEFIASVVRSPKIETMRYAEFHKAYTNRGVVYLPTVSYAEMGAWTLPPRGAQRFSQLVERAKNEGTIDADKPLIRGGHWRNFFSRYPESNWMHKRVAQASRRFHALPASKKRDTMLHDLHLAQANDAYWHGLFGGIYLPHLRRQVYSSLARLEAKLDRVAPRAPVEVADIDLDGRDEVVLANRSMIAIVRPHVDGCVCELTHYKLAHNFADAFARRAELYHDRMRSGEVHGSSGGPASIHDRVAFRMQIGEDELAIDAEPRAMFVDHWSPAEGAGARAAYGQLGSRASRLVMAGLAGTLAVDKHVELDGDDMLVGYTLAAGDSGTSRNGTWTVSLDVAMPSCDGPGGTYVVDGIKSGGFDGVVERDDVKAVELRDSELGGALEVEVSPAARIDARPLYTASQSEAGFERIMQTATIRISWPVSIPEGESVTLGVRLGVKKW